MTKPILAAAAAVMCALAGGSAGAHAFLDHAVPAVGATVASSPAEVQMFFTQELEPAFSTATVAAANGQVIATSPATVNPQDKTELELRLPPLAPGEYKVTWHVLSVDTHRTGGDFSFAVKP
jgi:hypothetical protein